MKNKNLKSSNMLVIALSLLSFSVSGVPVFAQPQANYVLTASNGAKGTVVRHFTRKKNGTLSLKSRISTRGRGNGSFLNNQNGLIVDGSDVLVVNAGSNQLSLLRFVKGNLQFVSAVSVNGVTPISVAKSGALIYVVSEGNSITPSGISGYILRGNTIEAIENSQISLSSANAGPAQISFTPDGNALVVTERLTNKLSLVTLDRTTGLLKERTTIDSSGATPFGFEFSSTGYLVVSEAFQGTDSALSSYRYNSPSLLSVISPSVDARNETDACWITITADGKRAYTTNTNVGTTSSYSIADDGSLRLLQPKASRRGGFPIDLDLSRDDRFLYTLNFGSNKIEVYSVSRRTGALKLLEELAVPAGSNGIWAS